MQIGVESIENLFMTMTLKKKNSKPINSKNTHFYLLENWLNEFQFGIVQRMIYES